VIDLCSIPQIQPDWSRWMGTLLPPPNQESPQDWGLLDIMQHVAAMLKHRVFRDALLTKASKQILQKFLDFEDRALAVFRQDALLLLGDLPPAMQPFLYCLAHPGTATWASRCGFQAMQSLDTCPSYVRVLAAFKVPADPHLEPSLSRLTQKAELAGLQLPD